MNIYVTDDDFKKMISEPTERAKNPGVWDGAPDWAVLAEVFYGEEPKVFGNPSKVHTRELPKTRARGIAEKAAHDVMFHESAVGENQIADAIEVAILEYSGEK